MVQTFIISLLFFILMDSKQVLSVITNISSHQTLKSKKLDIHPSTLFSEALNDEEKKEYIEVLFEEGLSSCIKYEDVHTIINDDLLLKYGVYPKSPTKVPCQFSTPSERLCYCHGCEKHGVNAYHKYPLVVFACDIHYHFHTPDVKDAGLKNAFYNQAQIYSSKSWTFQLTKLSDVVKWAVQRASAYGHLDALKWLTFTFQLTRDNIDTQRAFHLASGNGNMDVLKWLVPTFQLTGVDVRSDNNCAFRWASGNGHLDVLKWLTNAFQLTGDDALSNNSCAFRWASNSSHFGVVEWLSTTFPSHK